MRTRDIVDKKTREMIEATRHLRELVSDGDTICTITDYVGNQGTAYVRTYIIKDKELLNLTWYVGKATESKMKEREGRVWIRTGGGNYSRAESVTQALSLVLFKEFDHLKCFEL